jgi:hypothetical protein
MKNGALFRKMAPAIWGKPKDPSVYGYFELDVTGLSEKTLLLPIILKATADTIKENPAMNAMVSMGRVVRRKDHSISVMVNIPGSDNDLSALHLDTSKQLSIPDLRLLVENKAHLVRKDQDPHLGGVLKLVRFLPRHILSFFISAYTSLIYDFNTRLGLRFLPLRPFGSVIISNVGSLGLSGALLPLVPMARSSLMLSVGKITQEARVIDGVIQVRDVVVMGVTFDHRIFDGSHASKMLREFKDFFYSELSPYRS